MCLQKEKDKVVKLELQVTELEEQVGQVSDKLAHSADQQEKALEEIKTEKEAKQVHVHNKHFKQTQASILFIECSYW